MATDRRADDERWTKIEVSIAKIETHMERSLPAMEQVWKNKTDIDRIRLLQSLIIWIGGVTGTASIYTIIREFLSNSPPPQLPH